MSDIWRLRLFQLQFFAHGSLNLCCQGVHGEQAQRVVAPGCGVGHGLVAEVLELLLCLVKHLHALRILVLQLTQLGRELPLGILSSPQVLDQLFIFHRASFCLLLQVNYLRQQVCDLLLLAGSIFGLLSQLL